MVCAGPQRTAHPVRKRPSIAEKIWKKLSDTTRTFGVVLERVKDLPDGHHGRLFRDESNVGP